MSALQELDAALQPMLLLKPPGVSGSKIKEITTLCVANVKSESVIIQKIYTHFKKAPGTHKLGVLYVVDSVTRQWVDHARKSGQTVGTAAGDGTFAAGVNRVTELLPVLMADLIQQAPDDQKEKIKKLVDIWERGNTFPAPLLASFKEKLNAAPSKSSTTPPGSPSQGPAAGQAQSSAGPAAAAAGAPNTSAILAALANIAKQNTTPAPATSNIAGQDKPVQASAAQTPFSHPVSAPVSHPAPFAAPAPSVDVPGAAPSMAAALAGFNMNGLAAAVPNAAPTNPAANALGALASMLPQANPGGAEALQQQLMLIQVLMQQGVPQDQWAPILAALNAGGAGSNVPGANGAAAGTATWPQNSSGQASWGGRSDIESRDRAMRSPPRYAQRNRSRSPPGWRRDRDREPTPPRRRDSPIYGDYRGDSPGRGGGRGDGPDRNRGRGGRGGRGNDYRQRSPPGRRGRSPSPGRHGLPPNSAPKFVEYDHSLGKDMIKVLSRTLFIGGVTCGENELRNVFSRFGTVQTCIVNQDKRHGFIKMISRTDALAAKNGMETYRPPDMQLRTRWGVGFGPRDCSDYQTGISVIPIGRLTDADRKWMLTAEYGGSGGRPIESGMVVEEPDIEIGAGVSSKAISRRMATDQGGKTGPRSTRGGGDHGGGGRFRRHNDRHEAPDRDSNVNVGVPPAVPGFGFQFPTFPNGMPMMPPGFVYPGGDTQQHPPAGQN